MTAKRVDANQSLLVNAARKMGVSVWVTSDSGKGGPDFVLGVTSGSGQRVNLMVEAKDGSKVPSARKLTPAEEKFHETWKGQICIIHNVDELVDLINRVR